MTFMGIHPLTGRKYSKERCQRMSAMQKVAWMVRRMHRPIVVMGMPVEEWRFESCVAIIATGENGTEKWATIYQVESTDMGKGHCQRLLAIAKEYYRRRRYKFGGTVALSPAMLHIYKKLGISEYS